MKQIEANVLSAIRSIFETGVANTNQTHYTEEQWLDIRDAFDEMFYEFLYKCK